MRKRHFGHLAAVIACLSPVWAMGAQDPFADVRIKTTHVAGKVYMLEGRGGNIGVSAGEDGLLIIDDQFAPLAEKIRAALGELSQGKLRFVLNTHWHGDHTGGNAAFGVEAPIISHTNVRKRLSTPQTLFGRTYEPLPKEGLPVITFDDSLSIHFNGEEIKARHYPNAHTDGDIVIYFTQSGVVHMGDLFFNGMFPFVDLDHGGDVEGLTRHIEVILGELPDGVKIIPGHGPLAGAAELKVYHRMLKETTRSVRAAMAEGGSLAGIQASGLGEEWKPWGEGFIKTDAWVETIHRSLSRSAGK